MPMQTHGVAYEFKGFESPFALPGAKLPGSPSANLRLRQGEQYEQRSTLRCIDSGGGMTHPAITGRWVPHPSRPWAWVGLTDARSSHVPLPHSAPQSTASISSLCERQLAPRPQLLPQLLPHASPIASALYLPTWPNISRSAATDTSRNSTSSTNICLSFSLDRARTLRLHRNRQLQHTFFRNRLLDGSHYRLAHVSRNDRFTRHASF